jgi:hypothetical protein
MESFARPIPARRLLGFFLMRCLLFRSEPDCRCRAVRGRHIPTVFERDRYCRSSSEECPILRAHHYLGRLLSEDEYLEIWLPEASP